MTVPATGAVAPAPNTPQGLSSEQAAAALAAHGPNVLPAHSRPALAGRVARHLREPLSMLLLVAAAVSLVVLREVKEGVAILVIAILDAVVGALQEHRADAAVDALRELTAPTAKVRRDGATVRIPAVDVVPGDLLDVTAGDRIAADAVLVESSSLAVDEAALAGESLPVEKRAGAAAEGESPSDRPGAVFAGTAAVRGRATARVVATGATTVLGRLASSLSPPSPSPLEIELRHLGRILSGIALVVGGMLVPVAALRADENALAEGLLAGVALAVAAIPEGLPAAVTASLALGARRMAAVGGIVRRLAAIEAVGATSVLCVDKTGTLTTGRLSVRRVDAVAGRDEHLWLALARCNDAGRGGDDPVDVAIAAAASAHGVVVDAAPLLEQPFDAATRVMAVVHGTSGGSRLSVKGAPEAVLRRCRPGADTDAMAALAATLVADGLRVLAVADAAGDDLAASDLRPLGVVSLADTVRDSARPAAAACRDAGIRIVMVTGDHRDTAAHVARDVGLSATPVVTGAELAAAPAGERDGLLAEAAIVARVEPAVKVDLVRAIGRRGGVVAMTGDGVNDAPALQQADVGIAVAGDAGTDVAREAADLVVTNGDLGTIVAAVREGRRIYRNLEHVVSYLVAGNLSEIAIVVGGVLLLTDLAVPLLPVHLLWVNLITDGLPALALGVDEPPDDPLATGPRDPHRRLLDLRRAATLAARAAVVAAAVLGVTAVVRAWGWDAEVQRTQLLTTLVLAHLALAYVTRGDVVSFGAGWQRNRPVALAVGGSVMLHVAMSTLPVGRGWLGLTPLPLAGWLLGTVAVLAVVAVIDAGRWAAARRGDRRDTRDEGPWTGRSVPRTLDVHGQGEERCDGDGNHRPEERDRGRTGPTDGRARPSVRGAHPPLRRPRRRRRGALRDRRR